MKKRIYFAIFVFAAAIVSTGVVFAGAGPARVPVQSDENGTTTSVTPIRVQGNATSAEAQSQARSQATTTAQKAKGETKGSEMAEERRSQVATAVQQMLQLADRTGGIGQQVRVIAQAQNQKQEEAETALLEVENRSALVKLVAGPNFGQINKTRRLLEENRLELQRLDGLKDQVVGDTDRVSLANQIETIEEANLAIEKALEDAESKFSFLGWMFKRLAK
jgi:hypothetical protein